MLLAASESAVTKKPRLRFTRRRSSSVRPRGSFHSSMSRLMLISCGIQWLAQAARYFSQAHLYLNGTSWLTSALELMTFLSSTVTRRKGVAGLCGACFPPPSGTKDVVGWSTSSKLSMGLSSGGRGRQGEQLAIGRLALALAQVVHLAGRHVQVPLAAGERQPVAVLRVVADQPGHGQVDGVAEVHRVEHEQAPAGHHHRVQAGRARRGPQRRDERPGELAAAERDHWQASQSGLSLAHTLASSALSMATALSWPALLVDFSACVAPMARR